MISAMCPPNFEDDQVVEYPPPRLTTQELRDQELLELVAQHQANVVLQERTESGDNAFWDAVAEQVCIKLAI